MGKQDPFAKDDAKGESNMKEESFDFGDPSKDPSKGGGGRIKFIVAAILVTAALAAGAAYFLNQQSGDEGANATDAMKPPVKTVKTKEAELGPQPLPAVDVPVSSPDAAASTAPKLETPSMPTRQDTPPPAPQVEQTPKVEAANLKTDKHPLDAMHPTTDVKTDTKAAMTLPKTTKTEIKTDSENEEEEDVVEEVGATAPILQSPENGASRNYDESTAASKFTWSGKGNGWIAFSRNPKMSPIELKSKTKGNSYDLPRLLPGTWYWQAGNGGGKSAIRTFTVNPPAKRAIAILEPQDGASLLKDNGMISWKGDHKITYYRVELSTQGWANPNYRFATTGTQLQIKNVSQGQYQMRLGAFSEVSGRWEYTDPIKVAVQ